MQLSQLLEQFSNETGLTDVVLEKDRPLRLVFDETQAIQFEEICDEGLIFLYAILGSLPVEGREALLMDLLSANLFFQETSGGCLALDREHDEILLVHQLEVSVATYEMFRRAIGALLTEAPRWKARLEAVSRGEKVTSQPIPAIKA